MPPTFPYTIVVVVLFMAFAVQARNGKLEGKTLIGAGIGVGVVSLALSLAMVWPVLRQPGGRPLALITLAMMAAVTIWSTWMAWRQARVIDHATQTVGETTVIIRTCSPWRIRGLDGLLVPNTTALRSITGPAASLALAGGKLYDQQVRAAAPIKPDKVVATNGGGALGTAKLFHVAVHEPSQSVDAARLRRGIEHAAQQARKAGAKSIGVPVAALRGLSLNDTADALVAGTLHQPRAFSQIVFLVFDNRDLAAVQEAVTRSLAGS